MKSYGITFSLLLVVAIGCSRGANGQTTPTPQPPAKPFFMSFAPYAGPAIPFPGDDGIHVTYQLLLTNYQPFELRLIGYAVNSADQSCPDFSTNYAGDSLASLFISAGTPGPERIHPHTPILKAGESAVLFVFLDFSASDCIPSEYSNTLNVERGDSIGTPQTLQGPNLALSSIKALVLDPPLRGSNWWTPNGPADNSIHRRTLIALDGTAYYPEADAVDWVQLGTNGDTYSGDPHSNGSYFAYKSPVYAVADGVVAATLDGIPDNRPVQNEPLEPAVPINIKTIGGNYVVENIGGGFYAFYAHLIVGTLKVSPGQVIHAGDTLGELGNSGNSTEPHLHFQVMDGPAPLEANGIPFVLDSWTHLTYEIIYDSEGKPSKLIIKGSTPVTDQAFMNLNLGNF
ncbi:MAG: M23 family metallopeptidase [Terracidiphilus sp.]